MICDHVAKIFFQTNHIMLIIGRISFPIFAYCLVIGCIYTKNFRKYVLRLLAFGVLSQPLYVAAFYPHMEGFMENIFNLNIFFTLIVGAFAVKGLMDFKRYWAFFIGAVWVALIVNIDYGIMGIVLIIIFYLLIDKKIVFTVIVSLLLAVEFINDSYIINIFGYSLGLQGFSVLSVPLITYKAKVNIKVNKYIFYAAYPLHLAVIFIIRLFI